MSVVADDVSDFLSHLKHCLSQRCVLILHTNIILCIYNYYFHTKHNKIHWAISATHVCLQYTLSFESQLAGKGDSLAKQGKTSISDEAQNDKPTKTGLFLSWKRRSSLSVPAGPPARHSFLNESPLILKVFGVEAKAHHTAQGNLPALVVGSWH